MTYTIICGATEEEYDSGIFRLEDILARAFVVGNKYCTSADVEGEDESESYHVTFRGGVITDSDGNSIGVISNDIQLKYGMYGKEEL